MADDGRDLAVVADLDAQSLVSREHVEGSAAAAVQERVRDQLPDDQCGIPAELVEVMFLGALIRQLPSVTDEFHGRELLPLRCAHPSHRCARSQYLPTRMLCTAL